MPQILNPNLTLAPAGNFVTVTVSYTVRFNQFERNLAGLGLMFREHLQIMGVDQDPTPAGPSLANFVPQALGVAPGLGVQDIPRVRSIQVPRAVLNEDLLGRDEIIVRIQIEAAGMPAAVTTAYTDVETLRA